jgi:hypothetical protein
MAFSSSASLQASRFVPVPARDQAVVGQFDFHASKILSKAGLVRDTKQPDENLALKRVRPS